MNLQRNFDALSAKFDLLVIGAGVYGCTIARLAARGGLTVALVDRGDFGAGTSHNSLKLIHGGFRYIQHFDIPRIRESVRSQQAWVELAPHLLRPLQFVMPTHGLGTRSAFALAGALAAFQGIAWDRNRGATQEVRLPRGGLMSRPELLARYPMFQAGHASGGAFWYDPQMLDPNRMTLECVLDAARHRAVVVNHAAAVSLLHAGSHVGGAVVRCGLSGKEIEVRARMTVNAAGPWAESLLPPQSKLPRPLVWSRNVNVITRQLFAGGAVGVTSRQASDAAVGHTKRLFFVTPWRDCSIIGTAHEIYEGDRDSTAVTSTELQSFVDEVAEAMPGVPLTLKDVRYVHSGLTPSGDESGAAEAAGRAHRPTIWDHDSAGWGGLISVAGIKYTTAPVVARKVVDLVRQKLSAPVVPAAAAITVSTQAKPLARSEALPQAHPEIDWARRIYQNRADDMLQMLPYDGADAEQHVFRCRVAFAAEHEMATRLSDVIFRSTDHAERGRLTPQQLQWAAGRLSQQLSWTAERTAQELADVEKKLRQRFSFGF